VGLIRRRDEPQTGKKTAAISSAKPKIGHTPLYESTELSSTHCTSVWIKDENGNEISHTAKDRRNIALIEKYADRTEIAFVQITAGNSGFSMAKIAKQFEDENPGKTRIVVNIVSKNTPKKIKNALCNAGSLVVEMDLNEKIISVPEMQQIAQEAVRKKLTRELNESDIVQVEQYGIVGGYDQITQEIYDQMTGEGRKPARIFVSAGSGHTLLEITEKAIELWGEECPEIIGVTTDGSPLLSDEFFVEQHDGNEAEKLCTSYTPFKSAIAKLRTKEGKNVVEIIAASDERIRQIQEKLSRYGIQTEGASAAAFCGLEILKKNGVLKPDEINIVVNTGTGIVDDSTSGKILKKIKRKLRNNRITILAAAILANILISVCLMPQTDVEKERFLRLQRREYEMQTEYTKIQRTMDRVRLYLNRDGSQVLSEEELIRGCRLLPDMNDHPCQNGPQRIIFSEQDFTMDEAIFIIHLSELGSDVITIPSRQRITQEYLEKRRTVRERGPTLGELSYDIYTQRLVRRRVPWSDEPQYRFREFDPDNPFDPEKEELCGDHR